jgi:uncharacterized protein
MQSLHCPRCESLLHARSVAQERARVVVDLCQLGCGGIWLDADDTRHGDDLLDALAEAITTGPPTAFRDLDRNSPIACPVCQVPMRRYRWNYNSPVVLDQCPNGHGTWVDGGELGEMRSILASAYEPLAPEQQARLRARLECVRLEVHTRLTRSGNEGRLPHPVVKSLECIWTRFL